MLLHLIETARHREATPQARAVAMLKLQELSVWPNTKNTAHTKQRAHYLFAKKQLEEMKTQPNDLIAPMAQTPPDGQPIDPGYE